VCYLRRWQIQDDHRQRGVRELQRRDVLGEHGRDAGGDVCELPDRHVFGGIGDGVPAVPGERGVGGGERGPGVLLL
jgi:hypothetical protein